MRAWGLRLLALAIAGGALWRLARVMAGQLAWPYDIGNESSVLCVIQAVQRGLPLYGPRTYADVPFALTIYTPLYHLLVAALPSVAGAPFLAGRIVATTALLLAASALGPAGGAPRRLALPALAFGWYFLQWPALAHAAYLRHDSLALALSAWAVVLVARGGRAATAVGALLCVLAIATKQSYVAAALACGTFLLLTDRRRAALFLGVLVALLLAGAAAASLAWGRSFWFCTLVAPSAGAFAGDLPPVLGAVLLQPAWLLLALAALVVTGLALRSAGAATLRRSPYLLYALAALAVCAATIGRTGSNELYVLEPVLALELWIVWALGPGASGLGLAGRGAAGRGAGVAALGAAALVGAIELATPVSRWLTLAHGPDVRAERAEYYAGVRAGLARRGLEHVRLLNLGAMGDGFGVADEVCFNDGFMYPTLWKAGLLDAGPLVAAVQRRAFDVVMIPAALPMPPPESVAGAPLYGVFRAVAERYELAGRDASYAWFIRPRSD